MNYCVNFFNVALLLHFKIAYNKNVKNKILKENSHLFL